MIDLAISGIGLVFSLGLNFLNNTTFLKRYKGYRDSAKEEIVKNCQRELLQIIQNKDPTKIKEKLDDLSNKLEEQNKPLGTFDSVNELTLISFILFIVSILTNIINMQYPTSVFLGFSFSSLSYFSILFGIGFFGIAGYRAFTLLKKIVDYELKE